MVVRNFAAVSHMQNTALEVDLIPAQGDKLGGPQAVPEGNEDHRRIAVAPAVGPGGLDQALDLSLGQVLADAVHGVGTSARSDCPFYVGWRDQTKTRICHETSLC